MAIPIPIIGNLIHGAVGLFDKWNERKHAEKTANAKLKLQREDNDAKVEFTKAEWEVIGKQAEGNGWKDEYVTLVITAPLLNLFICTFIAILFAKPELITAATAAMDAVNAALPGYENILEVVVYAAVSIRVVKEVKGR